MALPGNVVEAMSKPQFSKATIEGRYELRSGRVSGSDLAATFRKYGFDSDGEDADFQFELATKTMSDPHFVGGAQIQYGAVGDAQFSEDKLRVSGGGELKGNYNGSLVEVLGVCSGRIILEDDPQAQRSLAALSTGIDISRKGGGAALSFKGDLVYDMDGEQAGFRCLLGGRFRF